MKNSTPYASTQNAHIRAFKRHRVTPRNWLGRKTGTASSVGSRFVWRRDLIGRENRERTWGRRGLAGSALLSRTGFLLRMRL
ncbi:hypothetical protein JZ751_004376 [Albula glossodonta]|uniref:Uncharacterized protein n=1 Tax=Albula glossodonta TaxID=121402 RepID=A0A8T2NA48_9TELE|nr:hypothetical protein JZ751_004376 [Albula glossodonta]